MPQHAYWQGQIRISLVQLPVSLVTATRRASQSPLHEYDRASGERIHHQDIIESGKEVKPEAIVKGFEASKTDIIFLEKEELEKLKLPSSDIMEIDSFVAVAEIPSFRFERPYFVLPTGKNAGEIYQVIHQTLLTSAKAGIGQVTIRGREELCALIAIEQGLMLETLRYDAELLDPVDVFKNMKSYKPKADYIKMAQQLVEQNSATMKLSGYHDRYHETLMKLIDAKQHHRKPETVKPSRPSAKLINFADALKKSLANGKPVGKTKAESNSKKRRKAR